MGKTLTNFVSDNIGLTLNIVVGHLLFWTLGFPDTVDNGYNDIPAMDGSIKSGPSGSGVFPITLLLVVLSTAMWFGKMYSYFTVEKED